MLGSEAHEMLEWILSKDGTTLNADKMVISEMLNAP